MKLKINGEMCELPEGTLLLDFVKSSSLNEKNCVAELGADIIEKSLWSTTVLKDGDELELIRFIGGG